MSSAIIGLVATVFVVLSAGRLGYDWRSVRRAVWAAALLFTAALTIPGLLAFDAEPELLAWAHFMTAGGALALVLAVTSFQPS